MNLNKIALVGEEGDADYFWKSDHEVLWLRHAFQHDKPPVIVLDLKSPEHISPPPGYYEALVVDAVTGVWQPLEVFNTRSAPLMTAKMAYVQCVISYEEQWDDLGLLAGIVCSFVELYARSFEYLWSHIPLCPTILMLHMSASQTCLIR